MRHWDREVASKVVGPVETCEFDNVGFHPYRLVSLDILSPSSMHSVPS